ncbi:MULTISPECIES: DUF6095 family protein [Algibacter]|uniref:Uncharacterized protein n=3 Tax=Algibacter lectus TaxID=221126 RepID=A0A090VEC3_9FLAO|nr:DUF6095 family protein [Algibacter lectus]MWW25856.1 hypothetical protein [Algibacter lectus]TDY61139.1 hypothetical protein DFQ06_3157 [Algibacter lectus]GAL63135.1 hypothetical protein JCM19300_1157 [Algibacter lectus]
MDDNRTDKVLLYKGVKTMIFAVLTLFMGPIILSMALSQPENKLYIPLLVVGLLICAFAVFLIFKGIRLIMNSMFKK